MDHSDIESGPLPAVKSLRSKFEQLAADVPLNSEKRKPPSSSTRSLLPPRSDSPRPRASSGTYSNQQSPGVHHLRTSTSSSDLKAAAPPGTKRPPPPPPPPPRVPSRSPSPCPSPLLRPVPVPAALMNQATANGESEAAVSSSTVSDAESEGKSPTPSINSLRSKFGSATPPSPSRIFTPRLSTSGQPLNTFEHLNGSIGRTLPPKPPIPPRPSTGSEPSSILFSKPVVHSQQCMNELPVSSPVSLKSIFDEDEPTTSQTPPPALPPRKSITSAPHHQQTSSSSSSLSVYSSGSNRASSETDISIQSTPPFSSQSPLLPPRPPRHRATVDQSNVDPSSSTSSLSPPPLPSRRSTGSPGDSVSPIPRLPARPLIVIPGTMEAIEPSPNSERKPLNKLPPPPTRTIGLGDKLPPVRRPPSPSSDEESAEEEDTKAAGVDMLPDSSHSSRRPPVLSFPEGYSEARIQVPAYIGRVTVSGTNVVAITHHHVKIYDLAISDIPIFSLETKDLGAKEIKITSLEFAPISHPNDRGYLLWLGTKEGHLFELDIRTGRVTNTKYSAHLHSIIHIFRYGPSMITLDDNGKTLIFSPDPERPGDVSLTFTQPRVVRVTEKLDFVQMIGSKLWTAARLEAHGPIKTPIIRVYDLFTPGSTGKSIMPSEHVGSVTSATILPSQPGFVYVGHEEGFITIWLLQGEDGYPQFVEAMKVSTSDVLCLVGVNNRLWSGARNGMITAYDVAPRPWVVTNCWAAHPGLPVLRLSVDYLGIEKTGRLCVVSVGRDEQVKLWDGLLGADWIDQELMKHEMEFSKFRELTMLTVSWNVDAARPDMLTGDPANLTFLHDVLTSVEAPDIIAFGFQEVIDLESRKMTAKNVLLGGKKKPEGGGISERVTGAYRRWYDRLNLAVRTAMPAEVPYSVIHTENLVGLFSCIFVKNTERVSLKDMTITTVKRGIGGRYGNKGGILARFVVEDTSICLINCHLAAGQEAIRQRNADITAMLEEKAVFPVAEKPLAYVGGGDGTMVLDHEVVFVSGDMNYRIDQRRDPIIAAVRASEHEILLPHDQLLKEIKYNRGCRLRGFQEGPLRFPPTYKYDRRSSDYDSSEKRRPPAWCDRILWRCRVPSRVRQLHYTRYEANVSDHRPISAGFNVTIKSIRHDIRHRVKSEVQLRWADEQKRLLFATRQFYVDHLLI